MKKRIKRKTGRNKISYKVYYWLTGIIVFISLIFFFRTTLAMYYYTIKEKFEVNEHGYSDLERSQKVSETQKIQAVLQKYRGNAFGLDISRHQGSIVWDSVEVIKDGFPISFVFVRATQGAFNRDAFFKKNWANLTKKNIIKGAYHYYDVNRNSTAQAKNFIATVTLQKGDLPPVLDVEELPKNQSLELLKKGILNWLQIVEDEYKIKPIIYSNDAYFIHHIPDLDLSDYLIWVANYNPRENPIHPKWSFWQFTEKGIVKGISQNFVDINVFNGNQDKLKELTIK
ncbi:MAG: glycoside hydrolase family 25 protein [Flavobacteriaceae bacterium]|jgi:lysozyme|nr:glycoside hydrolase family 25 protein [Flavobacteriaceae bacterium]